MKEKNKSKQLKIELKNKSYTQTKNQWAICFQKVFLAAEARDELNKIKETEQEISRDDL